METQPLNRKLQDKNKQSGQDRNKLFSVLFFECVENQEAMVADRINDRLRLFRIDFFNKICLNQIWFETIYPLVLYIRISEFENNKNK